MTPDQIAQFRNLLKTKIAISKASADNENYSIPYQLSIKEAEFILALLPCPTCNGTGKTNDIRIDNEGCEFVHRKNIPCPTCNDSGRVPTFDQASGLADADPCPDCQS